MPITNIDRKAFVGSVLLALCQSCIAGPTKSASDPSSSSTESAPPAAEEKSAATASAPSSAKASGASKKCENPKASADGLVDDFEDEDDQVADQGDRSGHWYIGKDDKGSTVTPAAVAGNLADGGANGTKKALHVTGKTAAGDGAWGVELNADFAPGRPQYDASKYAGVSFFIKAGATKGAKSIRLKISDVNTNPDGGACKACFNHFGKDIKLTSDWQEVKVSFAEMKQIPGWGDQKAAITPSKIYDVEWAVASGQPFDFWLDEIKFFNCGK